MPIAYQRESIITIDLFHVSASARRCPSEIFPLRDYDPCSFRERRLIGVEKEKVEVA